MDLHINAAGLLTIVTTPPKGTDPGRSVVLTTADAVDLLGRLTGLIPTMPAPELINAHADPEDAPDSYLCPHCTGVHVFDQLEPSLIEVDADVRENDALVVEEGDVHVAQGDQEYATMAFLCGYCHKPVSLPEDTPVTWD